MDGAVDDAPHEIPLEETITEVSGLMDPRKKLLVKLEGSIVKWLFMSCALVSILEVQKLRP